MLRLLTALATLTLVSCASILPAVAPSPRLGEPVATRGPLLALPTERPVFWVEAPIPGDPSPVHAQVPLTGARVEGDAVRLLRPPIADTPRRVAVQAGHWRTSEAPAEFPNLRFSTGASTFGVSEVDVTLDIAERVASVLRERGYVVDLLPATVPPSYLADVFVSLHADSDMTSTARGFKIAHGFYRSPHDALLVQELTEHYAAGTGMPWNDPVTSDMTDYYAFAWFRYEHALAPHTPAAIIEMGFISHPFDRPVLTDEPDRVARAIAEGVIRFLDAVPRSVLFGEDILVPVVPPPSPTPTGTGE
ncbi:MAG: N-acetylmuramoyl-L-alanine amidase [Candidatus Limnocylindria bacterium]